MKQEDERGFLSDRFDDWSDEPIPNGWNGIERKLGSETIRRRLALAVLPLMLLVSFSVSYFKNPFDAKVEKALVAKNEVVQQGLQSGNAFISKGVAADKIQMNQGENPASNNSKVASIQNENQQIKLRQNLLQNSATSKPELTALDTDLGNSVAIQESENLISEAENQPLLAGSVDPTTTLPSNSSNEAIAYLNPKEASFSPFIFETQAIPQLTEKPVSSIPSKAKPGFLRSISVQTGYAVSSVELNSAMSEKWKYSVSDPSFTQAGFASIGVRLEQPIRRQFSCFYGLEIGTFIRRSTLTAVSKLPESYVISSVSDGRYSVSPQLEEDKEIRTSLMAFSRAELGVRAAITRHSGVLASVQGWGRLGSKSTTTNNQGAAFVKSSSSIAPGFRIGTWWQSGPFSQVEFTYSGFPEKLTDSTPGISYRTGLLGLSFRQSF
jgi:hypothetical protein